MKILIILTLLIFLSFTAITAKEHQVDKSKDNMVKFISDAPIEDFEGVTSKIDGYMFCTDNTKFEGCEVYFEVDLNSVDTGIGLRNRDMREDYLETDKYPITHFSGKITKAKKNKDNHYKVTTKGKMFIHGVTKEKTIEADIYIDGNDNYHVKSQFIVNITDYDIEVPSLMFAKISEEMDLRLDFYLKKVSD